MLREPFLNRRARHSEQTIRQFSKGLEFLRWTAHVASMIVLIGLMALLAAQSQPPVPRAREGKRDQPQSQPTATQQQSSADQRGTEQSPIVVKVQPSPKTDQETAKEKDKEQQESSDKRWTRGLAGLTALVAILQSILIGVQARIASKQNKILESQSTIMDGQLRATEEAANAAKKSAEVAERALIATQRAFLSVKEINLTRFKNDDGQLVGFGFKPVLINAGQTPALNVRLRIDKLGESNHTTTSAFPTGTESLSSASVAPRVEIAGAEILISLDDVAKITSKEIALFIHAYVEYRDIFEGTALHRTMFCSSISVDADPAKNDKPFTYIAGQPEHNYAD